ncbi:MAG: hypothetical protein M1817_003238 [Caeruleum heppii]|nr:MAG: hypothetical protein M1817_003238 [Caeruleum heppii]
MASATVALPLRNGLTNGDEPSKDVIEYDKILRLRDDIFAGTHPRLKIPPHLAGRHGPRPGIAPSHSSPREPTSETTRPPSTAIPNVLFPDPASFEHDSEQLPDAPASGSASLPGPESVLPSKPGPTQIDPIFLVKSDGLIKAEIQLQRERLERALREQVDRQRAEARHKLSHDALPEFDVSEVLAKAQELVAAAPPPEGPTNAATSDSFDENSFYSSLHNESTFSGEAENHPAALTEQGIRPVNAGEASPIDDPYSPPQAQEPPFMSLDPSPPDAPTYDDADEAANGRRRPDQPDVHSPAHPSRHAGSSQFSREYGDAHHRYTQHTDQPVEPEIRNRVSISDSGGTGSSTRHLDRDTGMHKHASPRLRQPSPPVPVFQNRIRTPIAPQPARVSPLALARMPPVAQPEMRNGPRSPPVHTARESPVSAPRPIQPRKKRRTADANSSLRIATRPHVESPQPVIKEEPVSPPIFAVPESRARQPQQIYRVIDDDEPRYLDGRGPTETARIPARYVSERFPEERHELQARQPHSPNTYGRSERYAREQRRYASYQEPPSPRSPATYVRRYSPGMVRPVRAPSRAVLARPVEDDPVYYGEVLAPTQARYLRSGRSRSPPPMSERRAVRQASATMAPPNLPPTARGSAHRPGEAYEEPLSARYYEGAVPRASRAPELDPRYEQPRISVPVGDRQYDYSGIAQRMPPPRVVAQPVEEGSEAIDYGAYRERDYLRHPAERPVSRVEYVPRGGYAAERRVSGMEDLAISRASVPRTRSVRPDDDRYGLAREYVNRMPSARPTEVVGSHYVDVVRAEPGPRMIREATMPLAAERREYLPVEDERYAMIPPPSRGGPRYVEDGPRYVERGREMVEDPYGGDLRRTSYGY